MAAEPLYFIALLPPEPVLSEVRIMKEEMQRRFGAGHALKSPAHITLQMPFRFHEAQLRHLIEALEVLAPTCPPFSVQLDGFDCFPPRVLFVRVTDHAPVIALHKNLVVALKAIGFGDRMLSGKVHPHMTIAARDLREDRFEAAWEAFRQRTYQRSFPADKITLLRHNGKHWTIFREFPMQDTGHIKD